MEFRNGNEGTRFLEESADRSLLQPEETPHGDQTVQISRRKEEAGDHATEVANEADSRDKYRYQDEVHDGIPLARDVHNSKDRNGFQLALIGLPSEQGEDDSGEASCHDVVCTRDKKPSDQLVDCDIEDSVEDYKEQDGIKHENGSMTSFKRRIYTEE